MSAGVFGQARDAMRWRALQLVGAALLRLELGDVVALALRRGPA